MIRRTLRFYRRSSALAVIVVAMATVGLTTAAHAQLSGAAIDTSSSTCSVGYASGTSANGYCGSSAVVVTDTPALFETRGTWNMNGDASGMCPLLINCYPEGTQYQSAFGTAVTNVSFDAVAPMGYGLTVTVRRK